MALAAIAVTGGVALQASGTSARVVIPTSGSPTTIVVTNLGGAPAFVALGDDTAVATAASYPVLPGSQIVLTKGSATYVAALTLGGVVGLVITAGT